MSKDDLQTDRLSSEGPSEGSERGALDPPLEEMRRLGYQTVDLVVDYLHSLPEQRVARRANAEQLSAQVDEALPFAGRGVEDSLRFFSERVLPGMTRVNHPRFHAYIPGPSSFYSVLGELLAVGTNPFVGSWLGGNRGCCMRIHNLLFSTLTTIHFLEFA